MIWDQKMDYRFLSHVLCLIRLVMLGTLEILTDHESLEDMNFYRKPGLDLSHNLQRGCTIRIKSCPSQTLDSHRNGSQGSPELDLNFNRIPRMSTSRYK